MDGGVDWPSALGLWIVPAVIAVLGWSVVSLRARRVLDGHPHHTADPAGLIEVVRLPHAWQTTFLMGTQSLIFFALLTWLPTQLADDGFDHGAASSLLALFVGLGIVGAFSGAPFSTGRNAIPLLIAFGLTYAVGLVLLTAPGAAVVAGIVVCGLCQGLGLAIALTLIADQDRPGDVPAISALAQGVGYAWSALGPVGLGLAYDLTGGVDIGEWVLAVLAVLMALTAVAVVRRPRGQARGPSVAFGGGSSKTSQT